MHTSVFVFQTLGLTNVSKSAVKDVLMVFCPGIFLSEDNRGLTLVLRSKSPHPLPLILRTEIYERSGQLGVLSPRMARSVSEKVGRKLLNSLLGGTCSVTGHCIVLYAWYTPRIKRQAAPYMWTTHASPDCEADCRNR